MSKSITNLFLTGLLMLSLPVLSQVEVVPSYIENCTDCPEVIVLDCFSRKLEDIRKSHLIRKISYAKIIKEYPNIPECAVDLFQDLQKAEESGAQLWFFDQKNGFGGYAATNKKGEVLFGINTLIH